MKERKKINGRARVLRRRSDGWNTARLACRLEKRGLRDLLSTAMIGN